MDVGEQRAMVSRQQCSLYRASRHMPSTSLGQDASLSFVVIGKGQRTEIRGQRSEVRRQEIGDRSSKKGICGSGFSVLSLPALSLSNGSKGSRDLSL